MIDLDKFRSLIQAATPLPWEKPAGDLWFRSIQKRYSDNHIKQVLSVHTEKSMFDCRLVLFAVNELPEMIKEIEELRAENAKLKKEAADIVVGLRHIERNLMDPTPIYKPRPPKEDIGGITEPVDYSLVKDVRDAFKKTFKGLWK